MNNFGSKFSRKKELLIVLYIAAVFAGYIFSMFVSRLERFKSLLGL